VVLRPQAAVYQVLSNVVNQAAQLTDILTDVLNTRHANHQSDNVRRRGVQPPIDIIVNPPTLTRMSFMVSIAKAVGSRTVNLQNLRLNHQLQTSAITQFGSLLIA